MRSLAGSKIFYGQGRYETITEHLQCAWSRISDKAIKKAWNIKGLADILKSKGFKDVNEEEDEGNEDNNNNNNEFDNDEEEEGEEADDNDGEVIVEEEDANDDFFEEEELDDDEQYEDKYY